MTEAPETLDSALTHLSGSQERLRAVERRLEDEKVKAAELRAGVCAQLALALCESASLLSWNSDGDLMVSCRHVKDVFVRSFAEAHGYDTEEDSNTVLYEAADMRSMSRARGIHTFPRSGRLVCELRITEE